MVVGLKESSNLLNGTLFAVNAKAALEHFIHEINMILKTVDSLTTLHSAVLHSLQPLSFSAVTQGPQPLLLV